MEFEVLDNITDLMNEAAKHADCSVSAAEFIPEHFETGGPAVRIYGKDNRSFLLRMVEE